MIRFYSLFVVSDELMASPYIRRFSGMHDITLEVGKTETVNFLLQTTLPKELMEELSVMYDPNSIELTRVEPHWYHHQTLVTVELTPKELGSVRIGFSIPRTAKRSKPEDRQENSPLKTVSWRDFVTA